MLDTALHSELVKLCRAVAPELDDRPLYLLTHPDHLPRPEGCGGYTPLRVDVLLRDVLVDRGEWQGPGTTIVIINPSRCVNDVIGITLHELAHNLPVAPLPEDVEPTDALRAACLTDNTAWATKDDTTPGLPNWFPNHGRNFTRICLHLHFRAVWHRHYAQFTADDLRFAGGAYHLSSAYAYRRAIGDEPSRMLDATFAEIRATPEPVAFRELFAADLAYFDEWKNQLKNLEEKAA